MIKEVERLLSLGFHCIPCKTDKTPCVSWKKYMEEKPTIDIFKKFETVAILGGRKLEILDIDTKYHSSKSIYDQFKSIVADNIYKEFLIIQTPSGGYHYYYYTDISEGNQKLSQNIKKEVLFETRGNNGYCLCPPSKNYQILSGGFENIPYLTNDERQCLHQICRAYNVEEKKKSFDLNNCFDQFNQNGDVIQLLQKHDWKISHEHNGEIYFTRPGKNKGVSGAYNKAMNCFYVFTSSTYFSQDKAYNPSSVFIKLEASGDVNTAKEKLISLGFGQKEYVRKDIPESEVAPKKALIQVVEDYFNKTYEFRKNIINQKIEFRKINTDDSLKKVCIPSLWRELQLRKLNFKIENIKNLLQSDFVCEYDHFKVHFESLKYNGHGFIDKVSEYVKTNDNEFWKMMFKKALIRNIACGLYGIENRIVMTLSGEKQGTGKSTFIRWLNPFGNEYYTESPLRSDKDTQFRFSECFIYNLEELQALNGKDIEALKTIISQSIVRERKPFAIDENTQIRRCNFWASTNRDNFLTDTENTRWLIFTIESIDWKYKSEISINDVWAEAYDLYKNGFDYYLTKDEEKKRECYNKTFELITNERDLLIKYFENPVNGFGEFMTNAEIMSYLKDYHAKLQLDSRNLGRSLKQLGFLPESKTSNGHTNRGWMVHKIWGEKTEEQIMSEKFNRNSDSPF